MSFSWDSANTRLKSSPLDVPQTQAILNKWMLLVADNDIAEMLSPLGLRWTSGTMPSPREVCRPELLQLGQVFAEADCLCNPRFQTLILAQLACNAMKTCLFGTRMASHIAADNAKLIRVVLGKFRPLGFEPKRSDVFMGRCTTTQKQNLENVLSLISRVQLESVRVDALVPFGGKLHAVAPNDDALLYALHDDIFSTRTSTRRSGGSSSSLGMLGSESPAVGDFESSVAFVGNSGVNPSYSELPPL